MLKSLRAFIFLSVSMALVLSGCSMNQSRHVHRSVALDKKQGPPADFVPRKIKVVSIGDSLTEGVGDSTNLGGYIPSLKKDLEQLKSIKEAEFHNFGVKGNKTGQLIDRLKKPEVRAAIEEADMVIITIGGNDIMQIFRDHFSSLQVDTFKAAEKGYKTRLDDIFGTIRGYNESAQIVLVGIYNPFMKWFSDIREVDEIVSGWNDAAIEVMSRYPKSTFVPVADIFEQHGESILYSDYFHPNDRGYKLMAERIFQQITSDDEVNVWESE